MIETEKSVKFNTEQRLFYENNNDGNKNVLVSASAGSGKTTVMIERLIRLILENKTTVERLLVLTFTNASALDMKKKLKEALIREIDNDRDSKRLSNELSLLQTANFSTIHSFCAKLIRKYFYVIELSNDFSVGDEIKCDILKKEAIDETVNEMFAFDDKKAILKQYISNRKTNFFKENIISLYDTAIAEENPNEFLTKCLDKYDIDNNGNNKIIDDIYQLFFNDLKTKLDSVQEDFATITEIAKKGDGKVLEVYTWFNGILKELQAKIVCKEDIEKLKSVNFSEYNMQFGRVTDDNIKEEIAILKAVKNTLADMQTKIQKFIPIDKNALICQLAKLKKDSKFIIETCNNFREKYEKLKREENILDYSDLEHFAYDILTKNQDVLREIKKSFDFICVDEFQDTNGIQNAIVDKLQNGNLLVVGDAKQSIYGFRGCTPQFFMDKEKDSSNTVIKLNTNYRSADAVVDMVNNIFNYSMTEKTCGIDYTKNNLVRGNKLYDDHTGNVRLWEYYYSGEDKKQADEITGIYDIEKEANKLDEEVNKTAKLVANIIRDCKKRQYFDLESKSLKQITNKDIAILSRGGKNTSMKKLADCLKNYDINIVDQSESDIFSYQEIQVLISMLRLVDSYRDNISLVTVLKSFIGGFSDKDLLDIVKNYKEKNNSKSWEFFDTYLFALSDENFILNSKLREFDKYIQDLRSISCFVGAKEILDRVILDKNYEAFLLLDGEDDKVTRVRRFVSIPEENGRNFNVRQYLSFIDDTTNGNKLISVPLNTNEEAVRIMTFHSSKGLEFPVVIIVGANETFNKDDDKKEFLIDREYGFSCKYYDTQNKIYYETPLRALIKEKNNKTRISEELRLFYVATTRAKYELHICSVCAKEPERSDIDNMARYIDFIPNNLDWESFSFDDLQEHKSNKNEILVDENEKENAKKLQDILSKKYEHQIETQLKIKDSVTALNGEKSEEEKKQDLRRKFEWQKIRKKALKDTVTLAEIGTIAHKIMENYDFNITPKISDCARDLIEREILLQEEVELVNLDKLQNVIDSGVFDNLKGKKIYREQNFLANITANEIYKLTGDIKYNSNEKVIIQGIIDLLVIDGDFATIIDYKYSGHDEKILRETYKKQLSLYALAVETTLEVKVNKKIIISLKTGKQVEM